jgi:hypothetical protein
LDREGHPNWFIIANAEKMEMYYKLATKAFINSSPILEALKNKQVIPYFQREWNVRTSPADWKRYLHPAQVLQGKELYYYTYIKNSTVYCLEQNKVCSYQDFLETLL